MLLSLQSTPLLFVEIVLALVPAYASYLATVSWWKAYMGVSINGGTPEMDGL